MASIYRRGTVWWGRVQRQGREIRQSLKTTAEGIAKKRLKAWIDELDSIAWGDKPRRLFDDLALKFIDDHLPGLKPSAAERYLTSIAILADSFEGLEIDKITGARLSEFEAKRRKEGWRIPERLRGKKRPRPLKAPTIRRDLACLSSMFGFAIENEWCEANPVSAYLKRGKRRGLRESPPRRRYLSLDEEAKLLEAARDKWAGPDLYEAICVAIDTGLRRNEQLGLLRSRPMDSGPSRWLDLDRNRLRLTTGDTKNAKPRDVPLLPRARDILARKPAQLVRSETGKLVPSPYLFVNPETGTRYKHLNRGLAGAAKRAGIEPLTWQDLRRTCGCRLLQERRLSMQEVSLWLGHSSLAITETTYAFLEEENLQQAITRRGATGTVSGTGSSEIA